MGLPRGSICTDRFAKHVYLLQSSIKNSCVSSHYIASTHVNPTTYDIKADLNMHAQMQRYREQNSGMLRTPLEPGLGRAETDRQDPNASPQAPSGTTVNRQVWTVNQPTMVSQGWCPVD